VPGAAQGVERVALPARAVAGEREQPPRLLAPRVPVDVFLQVRHRLGPAPEVEQRGGAAFHREQAQLVEAGDLAACPRLVGELRVRGSPPQREPGVDPVQRAGHRLLEAPRVHVLRGQRVPGTGRDQQPRRSPGWPVRFECLAERADERLHRADRADRRVLPQVGHDRVHRHDPAARDEQPREHRPVAGSPQVHRTPFVLGRERPEHPERDHRSQPSPPRRR
jgi:hypothetical protein